MAIIEEVSDDEAPVVVLPLPSPSPPPPPPAEDATATTPAELAHALRALAARLALPDDLLPSYLNEDQRAPPPSNGPVGQRGR